MFKLMIRTEKGHPLFYQFLFSLLCLMAMDKSRYLGYTDVREASSNANKAVLLGLKHDLSQKAAAGL